jgi:hypothetical protein
MMKRIFRSAAAGIAGVAALSACASSPKKIEAAYVSPVKYHDFTCDQIGVERAAVAHRANVLYHSLKKRANADAAKMGVGAVLFLPTLFLLKGNGTKASEFARLKGDYTALRLNAEDRGCDIAFEDIETLAGSETMTAGRTVELRN